MALPWLLIQITDGQVAAVVHGAPTSGLWPTEIEGHWRRLQEKYKAKAEDVHEADKPTNELTVEKPKGSLRDETISALAATKSASEAWALIEQLEGIERRLAAELVKAIETELDEEDILLLAMPTGRPIHIERRVVPPIPDEPDESPEESPEQKQRKEISSMISSTLSAALKSYRAELEASRQLDERQIKLIREHMSKLESRLNNLTTKPKGPRRVRGTFNGKPFDIETIQ